MSGATLATNHHECEGDARRQPPRVGHRVDEGIQQASGRNGEHEPEQERPRLIVTPRCQRLLRHAVTCVQQVAAVETNGSDPSSFNATSSVMQVAYRGGAFPTRQERSGEPRSSGHITQRA